MAASAEISPQNAADYARLTKPQKLAALLIVLGEESAAELLRNMNEEEIEAVSAEMAKLTMISMEIQQELLREFTDVALHAGTAIRGGVDYASNVLSKAVGQYKASNVIGRVSPVRAPVNAMQSIVDLEARQLCNLLKNEQPQTVALIISYLSPEKASQVITQLRPDVREQVVERLANLAPTPIEIVEKVVEILNGKMGTKQTRAFNQTGGVKMAASLLNAMDRNLSKTILASMEERSPELGQAIRQKMFTFEDVATLEQTALQKVLRDVDMRDLAVALKTASDNVKTALLGCISKRAAEAVNEEMTFMGPLKLRDIEAAQLRIIEVVRRLETEGQIEIDAGNDAKRDAVPA